MFILLRFCTLSQLHNFVLATCFPSTSRKQYLSIHPVRTMTHTLSLSLFFLTPPPLLSDDWVFVRLEGEDTRNGKRHNGIYYICRALFPVQSRLTLFLARSLSVPSSTLFSVGFCFIFNSLLVHFTTFAIKISVWGKKRSKMHWSSLSQNCCLFLHGSANELYNEPGASLHRRLANRIMNVCVCVSECV